MRIVRKNKERRTPSFIGKIKIGERIISKNGEEGCRSLDYFLPFCKNPANVARFNQTYGEKPRVLKIRIPDVENCVDIRYELRKGKKKVAMSDGENIWVYNKETGEKKIYEKPFEEVKDKFAASAKSPWFEILRIAFVLPETNIVGIWLFETKGAKSTIQNIENYFDVLQKQNLPLNQLTYILTVEKVKSQILEKAVFPVVNIVADLQENVTFIDNDKKNLIENKEV
jgi:hypothetical protein